MCTHRTLRLGRERAKSESWLESLANLCKKRRKTLEALKRQNKAWGMGMDTSLSAALEKVSSGICSCSRCYPQRRLDIPAPRRLLLQFTCAPLPPASLPFFFSLPLRLLLSVSACLQFSSVVPETRIRLRDSNTDSSNSCTLHLAEAASLSHTVSPFCCLCLAKR